MNRFRVISLLLLFSIAFCDIINAQGLKRQVLGSIGGIHNTANLTIHSTFGQPPNAGTVSSTNNFLRQGFQQPFCLNAPKADAFFINDTVQCLTGNSFDFIYTGNADSLTSFNWNFSADATPFSSSLQNPAGISFASVGTKVLWLVVQRGICRDSISFTVEITQGGFQSNVTADDINCSGDASGSVSLNVIGGQSPHTYSWSSGDTIQNIINLSAGLYAVTITDAIGCQIIESIQINEPDAIVISDSTSDESCEGDADGWINVLVSGGITPYAYDWSTGYSTSQLDSIAAGVYLLRVTDGNQCEVLDTINVSVSNINCDKELNIYDVITPNNDGANDFWVVEGIEMYPDNEIVIFNRWGNIVYDTKGYNNDWYGVSNKGEALPSATYYYVIKLNDNQGQEFAGPITVIR